jgi:hypothetical protein
VAYAWQVLNGYWIGLCTGPQKGARALVLSFDGEGVLRSFNVEAQDANLWIRGEPRDWLIRRLGMQPFPTGPVLVPSTQPVTIPAGPAGTAPTVPLPPDGVPYRTPSK